VTVVGGGFAGLYAARNLGIDALGLAQEDRRVAVATEDRAERLGDLAR
jgi:flavin-dependent dehydrogenase